MLWPWLLAHREWYLSSEADVELDLIMGAFLYQKFRLCSSMTSVVAANTDPDGGADTIHRSDNILFDGCTHMSGQCHTVTLTKAILK